MLCCAIIAAIAAAAAVPLRLFARWRRTRADASVVVTDARPCSHHAEPPGEVPTAA